MSGRARTGRARRNPPRFQLRTRVIAGVLLVTVAALAAFDVAAVSALRRYLLAQTDSQLHAVLSLYRPGPIGVVTRAKPASSRIRPPSGNISSPKRQIVAISGPRLLLKPPPLDQYNVAFVPGHGPPTLLVQGDKDLVPSLPLSVLRFPGPSHAWTVVGRTGRVQLRLLAVQLSAKGAVAGTMIATTSLAGVDKTVARLRLILIVGSVVAGLGVALGVAWVVRRGLRPIEEMANQADRITAGDLTDRVSVPDAGTEVGRLGSALNGMLTRIEASVSEREANQELTRRFFADASHELRTPLASVRAYAELYQQGALQHHGQVDEAMRRIGLEARRMGALVDDMLRLARLDQHPRREHDPVDLTALLGRCAERAMLADPVRSWRTQIAPGLVTTGDEELLTRAVDNLLANVRAHTPGDTVAVITAEDNGDGVLIEVSDDGPGVPPDHLPHIFDRFYRAPGQPDRPGSGLGLAIVTAIASAHHGTASAEPNHPSGLRITLTLPATCDAAMSEAVLNSAGGQ